MPLTIEDLQHHLNMPTLPPEGDPRRREMQRALDTAVQELTRMTGRLGDRTVTVRVVGYGGPLLSLPYVDLAAVGQVLAPGGQPAPVSRADLVAGLVWVSWPAEPGGTWSITCTGNDWPAALETAALDWAAHVYDTQRTTLNPTTDDDVGLPSFALPNRVAQFARPYLLPGFA